MLWLAVLIMNWTDEAAALCVVGCSLVQRGIQSSIQDRIDIDSEGEMWPMSSYIITYGVVYSKFAKLKGILCAAVKFEGEFPEIQ